MRPIIGITQDIELKPKGGFWAYLDRHYAEAIYRFGGLPMLLPILEDTAAVAEYISRIDGLLLSGGDDIHPRYYGEELSDKTSLSPDIRTDLDFALLKEALAQSKPVLGICLGVQEMNVFFGGTLHQDIQGHKATDCELRHDISVRDGSLLHAITGRDSLNVNSYHHQAIKTVAPGLIASAAAPDGIVEAVELPGEGFVLGLQCHPERMTHDVEMAKIFKAFIAAGQRR